MVEVVHECTRCGLWGPGPFYRIARYKSCLYGVETQGGFMKLFFSPGACSMAPHIVLNELEIPFTAEKVDLKAHTFAGGDYYKVNPKGSVPCLMTDSNQTLTEGVVITQYLADQRPEKNLVPKFGTFERYQLMEMANYLAADVHKGFGPIFSAESLVPAGDVNEFREKSKANLAKKFAFLNTTLNGRTFLMGNQFTICDAYLFVFMNWAKKINMDMKAFPNLMGFTERVAARPAVQKTMKSEGLI